LAQIVFFFFFFISPSSINADNPGRVFRYFLENTSLFANIGEVTVNASNAHTFPHLRTNRWYRDYCDTYSALSVILQIANRTAPDFADPDPGQFLLSVPCVSRSTVVPETLLVVEYYCNHPREAEQDDYQLFDWLEENVGLSGQHNQMCGEVMVDDASGAREDGRVPVVLMAALENSKVLFEVLRRGGSAGLLVRSWNKKTFDRFFAGRGEFCHVQPTPVSIYVVFFFCYLHV
jgi:hypothetical protein